MEKDKNENPINNRVALYILYAIDKLIDEKKEWLDWGVNQIINKALSFWDVSKKQFILKDGEITFANLTGFGAIDFNNIACL